MSTEWTPSATGGGGGAAVRSPLPPRRLGDWLVELVAATDADPLGGGTRLRVIVGGWTARITLDDETVVVSMGGRHRPLDVDASGSSARPVDGEGATTSAVVLALIAGDVELTDAIADGWIAAVGHRSAVTRLVHAVEVILDASARVPALRRLAADFREHHGPPAALPHQRDRDVERREERQLLARLGLLGARS